jgi:hypothetical protein
MRPKVVAVVLFLASGILAVVFLVSGSVHHKVGGQTENAANASVVQPEAKLPFAKQARVSPPVIVAQRESPPLVAPTIQETDSETNSSQRVAELMALAMNDDSNSLHVICSELTNPDKEIRAGALAAAVQFGDRSIIPYLRQLADQTSDPFEKVDITKAADQLALPLLGESDLSQPGNGQQNGRQ